MNSASTAGNWRSRLAALLFAGSAVFVWAQPPGAPDPAKKPSRVALVIGNAAYRHVPLPNPVHDATDMAALLKEAGFEVVYRENASLKDMHLALREFGDRLKRESLGLFFFAGHGLQVRGRNYLVPVDADIGREDEVAFSALDLQAVMEKLDTARNHTNVILLDACRDNPFATRFKVANAGLAQIDAPPGTVVAFATAPGSTAADGSGRNGLYTKHLLANLARPGVQIEEAFKQVRAAVRAESRGRQTPWESTSLEGELVFKPAPPPPKRADPPKPAPAAPGKPRSIAIGAAPAFAVGDWWEWRVTNELSGEVRTYKRSVVKTDSEGVTMDNGLVRDHAGNTLKEKIGGKVRTYSPSAMFYFFPMTPGLSWSGTVTEGGDDYSGSNLVTLRVIGEEEIDTALGKLRAIRLERTGEWRNARNGKTGISRWTFWYHGPAKQAVRFERSNTTHDGRLFFKEVQEIMAFGVK
ncbi:MAG: caspase family protein [Betaproteobacteria bacterium]|nr:caspase family protein [Betaproteobacteria bacterium]